MIAFELLNLIIIFGGKKRRKTVAIMPSMSTSHGGVLYYVVKIPKHHCNSPDRTSSSLFLDENAITSTPISAYQYRCGNANDDDHYHHRRDNNDE